MIRRHLILNKNNSLLLIGPKGSGKSTLIKKLFLSDSTLWIDLLRDEDEIRFGKKPDELSNVLNTEKFDIVVIDEVQKFPKLLDIVHLEIEKNNKIIFILTGSSARKLKKGNANLLAGRVFTRELYPFTSFELGLNFDLITALSWGTLPKLIALNKDDYFLFLRSYVKTYIQEEVAAELIIRSIEPFRDFLEISAQHNGKILNYSKIANDIGVSDKSIKNYFQILKDTLIGFYLPAFNRSIRKRQRSSPKFYFFDPGVKRALEGTLKVELYPQTSEYGYAFEHFIILEVVKLNEYTLSDFKLSYFLTKDHAKIDLIIERPGEKDLLIEIKSTNRVEDKMISTISKLAESWDRECEVQLWSQDSLEKKVGCVYCIQWQKALKSLFKLT